MATAVFNWVKERSRCAPQIVFNDLVEMIQDDVKAANSVATQGTSFALRKLTSEKITVTREGASYPFARIEVKGLAITFALMFRDGTTQETFSVAPTLSEDGERVLVMDNKHYKFWQIRKKALEPVFFELACCPAPEATCDNIGSSLNRFIPH
jgi:hypothetical protein